LKIHKIAASAALTLAAAGSIVFAGATPAGAFQITGPVTVTPSTNLTDGQTVTVKVQNFGTDTGGTACGVNNTNTDCTLYVVECTQAVVSTKDVGYCDSNDPSVTPGEPDHVTKITTASNGTATGTFTVRSGSDFLPGHKGATCDYRTPCVIVVTDAASAADANYAGFAQVSFKDTRAKTKTTVKAKKTAKAGTKLSVAAATTRAAAALTGKVQFTDNGKKCGAAVKEKSTGRVAGKCKVVKGKNTIVATYSGDANYKTSKGTAKVTGKKK
jgi:Bacterial Ig-like domain (group 3)